MVFTAEDKILIKNLALLKHYGSRRLIKEFPNKGWKKNDQKNAASNQTHVGRIIVSNRTVPQHIGHGPPSSYCGKRPQTSLDRTYGQRTHRTLTQSTTGFGD